MAVEENVQLMRRWFQEVWNEGGHRGGGTRRASRWARPRRIVTASGSRIASLFGECHGAPVLEHLSHVRHQVSRETLCIIHILLEEPSWA